MEETEYNETKPHSENLGKPSLVWYVRAVCAFKGGTASVGLEKL